MKCRQSDRLRMRRVIFMLALMLASVLQGAMAQAPPADAIVARVNGAPIFLSQLREAAFDQQVPLEALQSGGLQGVAYRRVLTQIIDETLLVQQANLEGITVDEAELNRDIDRIIQTIKSRVGSEAGFDEFLAQHHLTPDEMRRLLIQHEKRRTLATQVVAQRIQFDPADFSEFKEARQAGGEPLEEVSLAQIMIQCPAQRQATEMGQILRRQALEAAREAKASPGEFMTMAQDYKERGETTTASGYLGWFDPASLQPALGAAVEKLSQGEISDPIATDEGYHVVKLIDRRSARELYMEQRFVEQRAGMLEELRREASIQLYDFAGRPLATQAAPGIREGDAAEPMPWEAPALPPITE